MKGNMLLSNKFLKNEKAQFTAVHWILVSIIGATIIIFALVFVGKTRPSQEYQNNAILVNYVDLFFNPFTSGVGSTGKEIKLPFQTEISFSCESGVEKITLGKGISASSREIKDKFIFAKDKILTDKIFIFSQPLNLPYEVSDLVIAFDTQNKYCLIYDADSRDFVISLTNELTDIRDSFTACNSINCCSQDSRVITFYSSPEADVNIVNKAEEFEYGIVNFKGKQSFFIDKSTLVSAIFSDYEIYDCNIKRIGKKISLASGIYEEKATLLDLREECSYININSKITELSKEAEAFSRNPTLIGAKSIYEYSEEIKKLNRGLNCAQVY